MSENRREHSRWSSYTQEQDQLNQSKALAALRSLKQSESLTEEIDPPEHMHNENMESDPSSWKQLEIKDEDRTLPPRQQLHPSNYEKLTKWFYNLLILLFVGLLIGLLMWGRHLMTAEG
ncbi:hypothetical protein [Paenibacillus sp. 481]|uniref:hypothetical protein n=1 Tax=Paenibacillus sp. 481 TaxID=2835869 RepID=UPI001E40A1D0|nr:hypothetical protein [Paenibacillus sp. 481]UHA72937.1 hypothetical protein KIK04_20340 [Paenibacillus sp. 481]